MPTFSFSFNSQVKKTITAFLAAKEQIEELASDIESFVDEEEEKEKGDGVEKGDNIGNEEGLQTKSETRRASNSETEKAILKKDLENTKKKNNYSSVDQVPETEASKGKSQPQGKQVANTNYGYNENEGIGVKSGGLSETGISGHGNNTNGGFEDTTIIDMKEDMPNTSLNDEQKSYNAQQKTNTPSSSRPRPKHQTQVSDDVKEERQHSSSRKKSDASKGTTEKSHRSPKSKSVKSSTRSSGAKDSGNERNKTSGSRSKSRPISSQSTKKTNQKQNRPGTHDSTTHAQSPESSDRQSNPIYKA